MKSAIIGLLAETGLHPGTEQSTGAIDLPVAREAATGYPVLVGSSLKGALKDKAKQKSLDDNVKDEIFGKQDNAGAVAVTDARLLLLPVRSLTGHYKWATCPYLLERFQRDRELAELPASFEVPKPVKDEAIAAETPGNNQLFLEELSFKVREAAKEISAVAEALSPLIKHRSARERLKQQLVVLSDDEFKHFAMYGLQVNARNQLDEETKQSKNLWYEETLPPDTLLYALLIPRSGKEPVLDHLKQLFNGHPYLQVGGNETVGQGWCAVAWLG